MSTQEILRFEGDSQAGYRIVSSEEMKIANIFPMKIAFALSV